MGNVKIKSPTDFANALLGALGLPDSKTNVDNVVGWEALEGGNWGNTAKYNPLNTSEQAPGSVNYNTGQPGSGVQAYTNWQEGIDATVQTLQNSNPTYNYSGITAALNTSQPWNDFLKSLQNSSWDGGRYAGVSGSSTPGSGGNPDSQSYGTGQVATQQSGAAADAPSKNPGAKKLQGLEGILQAMQDLYSPPTPGVVADITSFGTAPIQGVVVMVFVRASSAILMAAIIAMGLKTLTSGSSSGSSGGPTNVLEFVNNAQTQNRKLMASSERINAAKARTDSANTRAEASRNAAKERDANASARQDARHAAAKAREDAKTARSNRWADIHEGYVNR